MGNLIIGSVGWQVPQGEGVFYPADLPTDWQLDYYSNAFRVVLVPQADWLTAEPECLQDWCDSVGDGFGFYLAVDGELDLTKRTKIQAVLLELGPFLKGVVVFSETFLPTEGGLDIPVSLVSHALALQGWSATLNQQQLSGQPVGYYLGLPTDGKQQAAVLRSFMQQVPNTEQDVAFFIDGNLHCLESLTNLKVIGELLGY